MGRVQWTVKARGGAYDGWSGETDEDPGEILVMWFCDQRCEGHGTFNVENPRIVLRTAEAYRRVEVDADAHVAVYELDGPGGPGVEEDERELVGAGADLGSGWPTGRPDHGGYPGRRS